MRRRLATTRDTLQEHLLPATAENTELNYRTRITTDWQDTATLIRLASILTLNCIAIGFGIRLLTILPVDWGVGLLIALAVLMAAVAYARFLQYRPPRTSLAWAAGLIGSTTLFGLASVAATQQAAYLIPFGAAVAFAALLSHLITKQVCFFMSVNERIQLRKVRRWQRFWGYIGTRLTPRLCPEVLSYRLGFAALALAFAAGYAVLEFVAQTTFEPYAALIGVLGFLFVLPALHAGMDALGLAPVTEPGLILKVTWKSIRAFVCYNRHETNAAGVFRFPTKALRPPLVRDVCFACSLAFLTTALVAVSTTSPRAWVESHREDWQWGSQPKASGEPALTESEKLFLSQLPKEKHASYLASKRTGEREQASAAWRENIGSGLFGFLRWLLITLFICWIGPSVIFFAVLWFIGGRLLTAYYLALEAPDAYELPTQPTEEELAKGAFQTTPWDNRIERIIWSRDKLETEHFYLGTSIEGDYPILLHERLLQHHAHILGDTGSGKTALGVAPLLTQLIAREDCSVLIIDLKGDAALFAASRAEANRAGIPFKWFTNITERSSFVFNPLKQSHVPTLTSNQLTQGILQALSLEYGQDYGRGHFSALNEIVSKAYLKQHKTHVGSFRNLYSLMSDKDSFRGIVDQEDQKQTRQLVNTFEKLGDVLPMNVTEADESGPEVIKEQIDMKDLLRKKQVVYFYLSSSLEPTTVSAIAKLAMFSLMSAADQRKEGENNRVYVFVDEFQRVITENVTIFFEQARSKRLHFILANQTIGQLEKSGVDLTDVVESCTSFKQSFRASDETSIKRLIETSGEGLYHSLQWTQLVNDSFSEQADDHLSIQTAMGQSLDGRAEAKVTEAEGPRLEKNTIIEVSALPLASFVRTTEGSGYTQFSGYWTTVFSEFHITKALYGIREQAPWPAKDDRTVLVTADESPAPPLKRFVEKNVTIPKPTNVPEGFDDDLEKRIDAAGETLSPKKAQGNGKPKDNEPRAQTPNEQQGQTP